MRTDNERGGVSVKKIRSCVGFVFVYIDMWAQCTISCFVLPVDIVVKILVIWNRADSLRAKIWIFIQCMLLLYLFGTGGICGRVTASADVFSCDSRTVTTYALRVLTRETTLFSGNELTTLKLLLVKYKKLPLYAWCHARHEMLAAGRCV